jgi:adenosine deaminase
MDVRRLRKAELHCHVDGLINPQMLAGLNARADMRQLARAVAPLCPIRDLRDWLESYGPAVSRYISNNGLLLLEVLDQYLRLLTGHNVIYSEIMLSSFTFQFEEIDRQIELYRAFRSLAERAGAEGLQVEFLICIGRTRDRDRMERRVERILQVAEAGLIRGVALAGLEEADTVRPYADLFAELERAGLGIEIHAGEWMGPESIWEALEYGRAARIGHGLSSFEDPVLIEHIRRNGIHLELCPTSNLLLTRFRTVEEHPIARAHEEGLSYSINTDDPGPFCTDISAEWELARRACDLTEADFAAILANSLEAAFCSRPPASRPG